MCNFSKDRLELQVEVNVVEGMDMCTKEKQLGVNMQQQVIIVLMPFFDFMDSLKILKAICSHVWSLIQELEFSGTLVIFITKRWPTFESLY